MTTTTNKPSAPRVRHHRQQLQHDGNVRLEVTIGADIKALPGKTVNVAIALWWLHGMAKGKPFKLTQQALQCLHVERDAASAGLVRWERAGLIRVERRPGQRPIISIVK